MKIDLTRKEYRDLLDILYIANWVFTAHREEVDPRTKQYSRVEQKFLSLSKAMKYENLIEYYPEDKEYFPTREFEETSSAHAFIDKFENDTFWNELTIRLSERDLVRQVGGFDKIDALPVEERIIRLGRLMEFYGDELARNGLDNLQVSGKKRPPQIGKGIH